MTRIGGLMILASCVPLIGAAAVAIGGGGVSVSGEGIGGSLVTVALLLLALGSALLALRPPPGLRTRTARAGLALLPLGTAATVPTAYVSASSMLVLVYIGGMLLLVIGVAAIALALLGSRGRARWVGTAFVSGLAMAIGAAAIGSATVDQPSPITQVIVGALTGLAGATIIAGVAGLGLLGLQSARTTQ